MRVAIVWPGAVWVRWLIGDDFDAGSARPVAAETMTYMQAWFRAAGLTSGALFRSVNKAQRIGWAAGRHGRVARAEKDGAGWRFPMTSRPT